MFINNNAFGWLIYTLIYLIIEYFLQNILNRLLFLMKIAIFMLMEKQMQLIVAMLYCVFKYDDSNTKVLSFFNL